MNIVNCKYVEGNVSLLIGIILVVKRWQDYIEPGDELEAAANAQLRRSGAISGSSVEEEMPSLPLPEDVLTVNLGIDIIVVVTKVG